MTSGWEIAGTIADSVASLGTVGALVWAVYLYRRQLQDSWTDQASRVFVTLVRGYADDPVYRLLVVDNASDRLVFGVLVLLRHTDPEGRGSVKQFHIDRLGAHKHEFFNNSFSGTPGKQSASMRFENAGGRLWLRTTSGELTPHGRPFDPADLESGPVPVRRLIVRWKRRQREFSEAIDPQPTLNLSVRKPPRQN